MDVQASRYVAIRPFFHDVENEHFDWRTASIW